MFSADINHQRQLPPLLKQNCHHGAVSRSFRKGKWVCRGLSCGVDSPPSRNLCCEWGRKRHKSSGNPDQSPTPLPPVSHQQSWHSQRVPSQVAPSNVSPLFLAIELILRPLALSYPQGGCSGCVSPCSGNIDGTRARFIKVKPCCFLFPRIMHLFCMLPLNSVAHLDSRDSHVPCECARTTANHISGTNTRTWMIQSALLLHAAQRQDASLEPVFITTSLFSTSHTPNVESVPCARSFSATTACCVTLHLRCSAISRCFPMCSCRGLAIVAMERPHFLRYFGPLELSPCPPCFWLWYS